MNPEVDGAIPGLAGTRSLNSEQQEAVNAGFPARTHGPTLAEWDLLVAAVGRQQRRLRELSGLNQAVGHLSSRVAVLEGLQPMKLEVLKRGKWSVPDRISAVVEDDEDGA